MPPKRKSAPDKLTKEAPQLPLQDEVQAALAWLESKSTQRDRENLARFAISTSKFFGVSMTNMKVLAKDLGRNHELAAALWDTGWYEARMLASLVDEPARVTAAQMDRWCRDFDNWAICDTACFALFDRTPHAWRKVAQWSRRRDEFGKRAAFALLWGLTVHDKRADDEPFLQRHQDLDDPQPEGRVPAAQQGLAQCPGGRRVEPLQRGGRLRADRLVRVLQAPDQPGDRACEPERPAPPPSLVVSSRPCP